MSPAVSASTNKNRDEKAIQLLAENRNEIICSKIEDQFKLFIDSTVQKYILKEKVEHFHTLIIIHLDEKKVDQFAVIFVQGSDDFLTNVATLNNFHCETCTKKVSTYFLSSLKKLDLSKSKQLTLDLFMCKREKAPVILSMRVRSSIDSLDQVPIITAPYKTAPAQETLQKSSPEFATFLNTAKSKSNNLS